MKIVCYNNIRACDERAQIAGLCKGSTTDSDSVCEGSNPSPAANQKPWNFNGSRVFCLSAAIVFPLVFPLEVQNILNITFHAGGTGLFHLISDMAVDI